MRDAPEIWLDWALLMNAKYPLGRLKFEKGAERQARAQVMQSSVGWANVLAGTALERFTSRFRPKHRPMSRRMMNRRAQEAVSAPD